MNRCLVCVCLLIELPLAGNPAKRRRCSEFEHEPCHLRKGLSPESRQDVVQIALRSHRGGLMDVPVRLESRLPDVGVSIFAVMTRLANEHGAINLSQGFPDFACDPALVAAVHRHMQDGANQYAPMPGVLALREALSAKIASLYGAHYDPVTEMTVTSGATEALFDIITGVRAPGRRGRAVRAVLRRVRAGRPAERRHAAVRDAARARLPRRLGRDAPRRLAAHAPGHRQLAAQPHGCGPRRGGPRPPGRRCSTAPTPSSSATRSTSTSSSTDGGTRASRAIPSCGAGPAS